VPKKERERKEERKKEGRKEGRKERRKERKKQRVEQLFHKGGIQIANHSHVYPRNTREPSQPPKL
jgi:hypothetical protein